MAVLERGVFRRPTADHYTALASRALRGLAEAFDRGGVDERPEENVALRRVADFQAHGFLDEHFHERRVDGLVNVGARAGGAFLPAVAERRAQHALGRVLEICRGHDDDGIFPAHFRDARPRNVRREAAQDFHPDRARAGEDQAIDAGVGDEFLADLRAGAGDDVDDADGQASVVKDFMQAKAGEGRVAGGLDDDGVPRNERARGHARGKREGKVERRDHGPHAVRPEQAARLFETGAAHRLREAAVQFHLARVVEQQVGGLGNFRDRLGAGLAGFEREDRGVFELMPGDVVRRRAQECDALRPAESAPVRIRLTRGLDRLGRIGARAALKMPDDLLGVRGIEVGKRALARLLFAPAMSIRCVAPSLWRN